MFDRILKKLTAPLPKSKHEQQHPQIPRLYPNIEDPQFALFQDPALSAKIKNYSILELLPFVDGDGDDEDILFGAGLSRLLIRHLSLIRNISVLGDEDTPKCSFKDYCDLGIETLGKKIIIGGAITHDHEGLHICLKFLTPSGKRAEKKVKAADGPSALLVCAEAIARAVKGEVTDEIREMWRYGQPTDDYETNVIRLGLLRVAFEREDPNRTAKAMELFQICPTMSSICSYIDGDHTDHALPFFLHALQMDPFNPSLYFTLYCEVWQSTGHEPQALQFIRRGLELSPAHGKLNMCAPHSVHPSVKTEMLHHSELGYRLLPGNSFAINNYISNLRAAGDSTSKLLALAEEAMKADPYDPGTPSRMLSIFIEANEYSAAMQMAKQLYNMYTEMNPRTHFCIQQNPQNKQLLDSGYDFAADAARTIQQLQAKLNQAG